MVQKQATQVQVQVPAGAVPGSQFQVAAGGKMAVITVPAGAVPGTTLLVNV